MSRRSALVIAAVSVACLVAAAFLVASSDGDGRADLAGAEVTTTTSTVAPSTTAPAGSATTEPTSADDAATGAPVELGPAPPPPAAPPVALSIPAIGLVARTVPVAQEPDGKMEVPPADLAGWYSPGARPGSSRGSAVIAGHVDHEDGPGVFIELGRLQVGDQVTVTDATGRATTYAVSERFQVGKEQLPTGELFRGDGPHVLTLITCGGSFDDSERSYSDNIVVRAVPVPTAA